jgi:hypothetical protein
MFFSIPSHGSTHRDGLCLKLLRLSYWGRDNGVLKGACCVRACRDELREPLLAANGAMDEEAGNKPKIPPPAPSSSADSDDEEEADEGYWARLQHLWSSPLVATACCIFLCFILKVVQQVGDPPPPPNTPAPFAPLLSRH